MEVDRQKLKELRDRTAHSFRECREALLKANNDLDKALQILRERHKPIGLIDG